VRAITGSPASIARSLFEPNREEVPPAGRMSVKRGRGMGVTNQT